jgi:hypothetical protein
LAQSAAKQRMVIGHNDRYRMLSTQTTPLLPSADGAKFPSVVYHDRHKPRHHPARMRHVRRNRSR